MTKLPKKPVTINLTQKQINVLEQLSSESGMNKSEIIGKLIIDYQDSLKKKICP